MVTMIEIKKDEDPTSKRDGLLFIDGAFIEKVDVRFSLDEQTCYIASNDEDTSIKLAAYSISDFPISPYSLRLACFPDSVKHLDKDTGILIRRESTESREFLVYIVFGGSSLSEWKSGYSFSEYAYEMYQILKTRDEVFYLNLGNINGGRVTEKIVRDGKTAEIIKIDLEQIDKSHIHSLEVVLPYSSPDVKIVDELERIFNIIRKVHEEAVRLITPSISTHTLEIRKVEGKEPIINQLFINGSLLEESEAHLYGAHLPNGAFWHISLESHKTFYELANSRFSDIPDKVTYFEVKLESELFSRWRLITGGEEARIKTPQTLHYIDDISPGHFYYTYSITFFFSLDVNNWRGQYTPQNYADEINRYFANNSDVYVYFNDLTEYRFNLEFRVTSPNSIITDEILLCRNTIRKFLDEFESNITSTSTTNSIVTSFNFPEEVAVSCEQYLLYFIQFLRDLGVEASSELKHKAGEVLFTVTPTDERDALDKIQEALSMYLELPFSPISNTSNEIAIQRLESSVLRLQSELKLAEAEKQAKDIAIEGQRFIIEVQKSLLKGEVIGGALKDVTPKVDDKENILGGTVALTKIGKGVELNLAETYRKLKRLLKGEK
jgi:hypothetical protein